MSLLAGFPLWKENGAERFWGSLWNTLVAVGLFMLLGAVTLPLWLFGFPALVLPVLLAANLNQRLFR